MPTDAELMALTARGDTAAFGELVERYHAHAVALAFAVLHDAALAQDVAQDCFARIYVLRQQYRSVFSFETYLRTLVRHRAIDVRRRTARCTPLPDPEPAGTAESPEALYWRHEEKARLLDAVAALPPVDQTLLKRYALNGASYQQLAEETGLTPAQVKMRLHRLRVRLRRVKEER